MLDRVLIAPLGADALDAGMDGHAKVSRRFDARCLKPEHIRVWSRRRTARPGEGDALVGWCCVEIRDVGESEISGPGISVARLIIGLHPLPLVTCFQPTGQRTSL